MADLHEVRIEFDRRVPMRDGVELAADVFRPADDGQYPVILSRTPYVKATERAADQAKYFAQRGYVVEMSRIGEERHGAASFR